jgi:hypothetical protein
MENLNEWQNTVQKVKQHLDKEAAELLKEFDRVCSLNGILCGS